MFKRLFIFIVYWLGMDALFYWLNRKAKRIICFHSVLPHEIKKSSLACGLDNSEDEFRTILHSIKKRYGFSTNIFDATTVTLSFDDGFLNPLKSFNSGYTVESVVPVNLSDSINLYPFS